MVRLADGERDPGQPDRTDKHCVDKDPVDGLCVYNDRQTHGCSVWSERPAVCRSFDCNQDPLLQVVARDGYQSLTALVTAPPCDEVRLRVPVFSAHQQEKLERLRARYDGIPADEVAADAQLAHQVAELKQRIVAAIGEVDACTGCARAASPPRGWRDGGACCSRDIDELFTDDELWLIRAADAGGALAGPGYRGSGCAFRTPEGCALPPAARPCLCVHYMCDALRDELRQRGDLDQIQRQCDELEALAIRSHRTRAVRAAAAEIERLFDD